MYKEIVLEPNNNINNKEFNPKIHLELRNMQIKMHIPNNINKIKDIWLQIMRRLHAKLQLQKLRLDHQQRSR